MIPLDHCAKMVNFGTFEPSRQDFCLPDGASRDGWRYLDDRVKLRDYSLR